MEAEVDKLELMFQKADSDLDYIQYRLEYEIKTNYPDSAGKKNPVTLLKELSAIKSRYQTLHVRFKPISVEQKETKSRICATFNKTMTLIQELQKETDLERSQRETWTHGEQSLARIISYPVFQIEEGNSVTI
ncbi:spindle and kinetochore-associated protein 2 isoform X1 [Odocoileus virginianus]|uniref:Protein FAM33A n=1 Tax=Odocoileus virginianus TaxID=9874 RepID=A0A6J0Y6I1_ODOVR|nr:spindle and kinetochore-associated protein 2 isoform X1 [Odocoileus virginianus texanus]XP_020756943.1 spindle and kinetochore-associated protein 2 isoform X1 [Odocoileus virginianus texanus]